MTIDEMRALVELPDASDAEVVAAYAALIDDGLPVSIVSVEPVSVGAARMQCRIDDEIEDDVLAQKIRAAREWLEDYTGRIFAQQTLTAHFDSWGSYLEIVARPIISIDAIAYNGEVADEIYAEGLWSLGVNPLKIRPGVSGFPTLRTGGGITVAYTAGYDAGEVPHCVIEAILVMVGGMMAEREGAYGKSLDAAMNLVDRLRVRVI